MKSKFMIALAALALVFACKSAATAVAVVPEKPVVEVALVPMAPDAVLGKTTFENNCANCHDLYAPTSYTNEEWQPILLRMQKKAQLDDKEIADVRAYLIANNK